jgi:hypothetical protein
VLNFEVNQTISRSEKPQYRINVITEYRTFTYWVPIDPTWHKGQLQAKMLHDLNGAPPATITYQKNVDNKFYEIFAYNRKADEIPE